MKYSMGYSRFTSSLGVFIDLLTNICNDMALDILGEAEH